MRNILGVFFRNQGRLLGVIINIILYFYTSTYSMENAVFIGDAFLPPAGGRCLLGRFYFDYNIIFALLKY